MEVRISLIVVIAAVSGFVTSANGKPIASVSVDPELQPARESELLDYLIKYGYLSSPNHRIGKVTTMEDFRAAVKKMQRFAGYEETGDISDPRTLALVKRKRCGLADLGPSDNAKRKRRWAHQGTSWKKNFLTYRLENHTPDIAKEDVDKTITKAIEMWSNASGLTIKREDDPEATPDIKLSFVEGFHGDTRPADGPGGELAHAFFPLGGKGEEDLAGDVHFDDEDKFAINGGAGVDLLWLSVHELGHSLGLDHTYHPASVMFAYYPGYVEKLKLDSDDVAGIQALYGLPDVVAPQPDPTPKTCSDVKLDAMVTTADKKTYAFNGQHFWEIRDTGGASGPHEIKAHWPDLEENIDAAYTVQEPFGHTIFFKDSRFWVYRNKEYIHGPAQISQLNLPDELANVDAAFQWVRNGKIYFFKGSRYWRFTSTSSNLQMDAGYPRDISVWRGVPYDINAVFQWKNGRSYFFKGNKYYAYDDARVQLLEDNENPYPRDVASNWMGCVRPDVAIRPVGAAFGLVPNVLLFMASLLITWLF